MDRNRLNLPPSPENSLTEKERLHFLILKFNFRSLSLLLSGHVYVTMLSPELAKYFLCVFESAPHSLGTAVTMSNGSVHAKPGVGHGSLEGNSVVATHICNKGVSTARSINAANSHFVGGAITTLAQLAAHLFLGSRP